MVTVVEVIVGWGDPGRVPGAGRCAKTVEVEKNRKKARKINGEYALRWKWNAVLKTLFTF
jgi:hypothetical protein